MFLLFDKKKEEVRQRMQVTDVTDVMDRSKREERSSATDASNGCNGCNGFHEEVRRKKEEDIRRKLFTEAYFTLN
ncbi:MAG: hypothetical protein EAZ79_26400 [Oscillatoriales cyanobacterium]|nr:MAG: hypothetical protein EAZ79_26400 [Oscillatoriales cyanobacterium]